MAACRLLNATAMCLDARIDASSPPLRDVARADIRCVLELVQLDRPGAARAVALKMRCLADDALLARCPEIRERATNAAHEAERWDAGDPDEARAGVVREVLGIARALVLSLY